MVSLPFMFIFIIMYLLSINIVMNSDDWFVIWLGLEINMLGFIALIYYYDKMKSIESCLKYFFVQSLGSVILISFMFFDNMIYNYVFCIILCYKMGGGFFYFWFPSVCSGLSWFSCFLLMSMQKIIPLMLIGIFLNWMMWLLILFSLVVGAMGSFNQKQMKRLMAFSSVHHIGWLLICEIMNSSMWLFYLFLYSFMIYPVIYVLMYFNIYNMMMINKWKNKWLFVMSMLSMAGMPPFLGFFLKWIVFFYMFKLNMSFIFFMILMSIIMFYIYMRVIYDLLLGNSIKMNWEYYKMKFSFMLYYDFLLIFGLMFGMLMSVFIIL